MQFSKKTSIARSNSLLSILIKVILILVIITGIFIVLGKIDFPAPAKEIEKIISNEKIKIVK